MFMTSLQEARGHHLGRSGSLTARLALFTAIGLIAAGRADASPYYTVTDLGSWGDIQSDGSRYDNSKTGASYLFSNPTTMFMPMIDDATPNLPTVTLPLHPSGSSNSSDPTSKTFAMAIMALNGSGTVIGVFPTAAAELGTYPIRQWGYTVRSGDQYAPFVVLASADALHPPVFLSQANHILIKDQGGARLLDLNTGVTSSLQQLIPAQILKQYPNTLIAENMNGRGDILIHASGPSGEEAFILTPPGLDPPTVPEPSTLLIFAAAGALAVRTARRRKGA